MTKIGLVPLALLLLISAAYGQKVKYKDIYALLSTKQFEQAEPFLKQYLRENTDNPNAFLFMGNIFQEKSTKNDILKQTDEAIANMDSAILFYQRAHSTLDDREVRRNKEYYQSYNRRDLRTGEFGVKLSDIQFDLEKRVEGLRERIDRVKMVKHFFALADTTYQRAQALYIRTVEPFASGNQMFLRSDPQMVKDLAALSLRFDSCLKAFDKYKAATQTLGKTGYNQVLQLSEIQDIRKDGRTHANFFDPEPLLWDYGKFADHARQVIEAEVVPMRAHLIAYDMEINKLREKLSRDSVSVRSDLTGLIDKLLYDQLKRFDPEPLPMAVFQLKIADLDYRSALAEYAPWRDSADIHFQVSALQQQVMLLGRLDSIGAKVNEVNLEAKAPDYEHFIENTYSNTLVLRSFLRSMKDFSERELRKKEAVLAQRLKSLRYIVDESDSIPLAAEDEFLYKPLLTSGEEFTMGLHYRDTTNVQGYFYSITPSRRPDLKVRFAVEKNTFRPRNLSVTKALVYTDGGGQIYYVMVFSEKPQKDKYPVTLAKIYRADGLAWTLNYGLPFLPRDLMASESGELIIRNGALQAVVDKNGKMVR